MNAEAPDNAAAKRVVIDASALIVREPESDAVTLHFTGWISDRVELHAPELARYEIANALTRKVSHGEVQDDDLPAVWAELDALPIVYHPLTDGVDTISLAIDLERRSAFDAAYVALARGLGAELWTLDGPACTQRRQPRVPGQPDRVVHGGGEEREGRRRQSGLDLARISIATRLPEQATLMWGFSARNRYLSYESWSSSSVLRAMTDRP